MKYVVAWASCLGFLLTACSQGPIKVAVPDLSGIIETWLKEEHPDTKWTCASRGSGGGSIGSAYFEYISSLKGDKAPKSAVEMYESLMAYVASQLEHNNAKITDRTSGDSDFNMGYECGDTRGCVVAFVNTLADGQIGISLYQYERR